MRILRCLLIGLALAASEAGVAHAKSYVVQVPTEWVDGGDESHVKQNSIEIQVVSGAGVMQLKVGHVAPDFPDVPYRALVQCLQQDKESPRFRVTWKCVSVDFDRNYTLIYDRTKHLLKTYDVERGMQQLHAAALLAGVTDTLICRTVGGYKRGVGAGSFDERLRQNGAHVIWSNRR